MSEKRKVRGLLDMLDAERSGEAWEWAEPASDFVPGMGIGATAQATRWAWLGMQMEAAAAVERALKRPAGRPTKDRLLTKDAVRAFAVWRMCYALRHDVLGKPEAHITARELVRLIRQVEASLEVPRHCQLFARPDETVEPSITRGKSTLEIGDDWNSALCEELWFGSPQTT
ncbi:MAG: hypothetical protein ACXIU8_14040 [Alkalilacustris sp.]